MDPPKPTGEYAVGTITYTVKNVREESLAPGTMRSVAARVCLRHTKPVYKAVFRDMKHMGFSDMKFAMKPGYTMGRLDPDKMHVNLCGCMLEMFDAFLKGTKSEPDIKRNNVITVTKYDPDI